MGFLNSFAFMVITFVAFTILVAVISYLKSRGVNEGNSDGFFWPADPSRASSSQAL